jgi:hypothetical protein
VSVGEAISVGIRTQVLIVTNAKTRVLHIRLPTFDDCQRCKKKVPFSKRVGRMCKPQFYSNALIKFTNLLIYYSFNHFDQFIFYLEQNMTRFGSILRTLLSEHGAYIS